MSNRQELLRARRARDEAQATLDAIQRLPRRKGARVRWPNGVTWERYGDDDWRAVILTDEHGWEFVVFDSDNVSRRYSSEHVATVSSWERVS